VQLCVLSVLVTWQHCARRVPAADDGGPDALLARDLLATLLFPTLDGRRSTDATGAPAISMISVGLVALLRRWDRGPKGVWPTCGRCRAAASYLVADLTVWLGIVIPAWSWAFVGACVRLDLQVSPWSSRPW